jgi:hypothetical protein
VSVGFRYNSHEVDALEVDRVEVDDRDELLENLTVPLRVALRDGYGSRCQPDVNGRSDSLAPDLRRTWLPHETSWIEGSTSRRPCAQR